MIKNPYADNPSFHIDRVYHNDRRTGWDECAAAYQPEIDRLEAQVTLLEFEKLDLNQVIGHLETRFQDKAEALENAYEEAKAELLARYRKEIDEVWYWQGDETDGLDNLTCPILIEADDLRELLARKEAQVKELQDKAEALENAYEEAKAELLARYRRVDAPVLPDMVREKLLQILDEHVLEWAYVGCSSVVVADSILSILKDAGYVRLADNQQPPLPTIPEAYTADTLTGIALGHQAMLNDNFRRIQ